MLPSGTPSIPSSQTQNRFDDSTSHASVRHRCTSSTFTFKGVRKKATGPIFHRCSRVKPKQKHTFTDSIPPAPTPTPEQLAQARLISSEFAFVRADDNFNPTPYAPTRYQPEKRPGKRLSYDPPYDGPSFSVIDYGKEVGEIRSGSGTSEHGFGVLDLKRNKDGEDVERAETASEIEVEDMLDAQSTE